MRVLTMSTCRHQTLIPDLHEALNSQKFNAWKEIQRLTACRRCQDRGEMDAVFLHNFVKQAARHPGQTSDDLHRRLNLTLSTIEIYH